MKTIFTAVIIVLTINATAVPQGNPNGSVEAAIEQSRQVAEREDLYNNRVRCNWTVRRIIDDETVVEVRSSLLDGEAGEQWARHTLRKLKGMR